MHIGASKFSLRQWTVPLCKFITIWGYGSYIDLICIRNDVQKSGFSWPRKSFSVHGMACKSCHSTVKLKQAKPSKCKCNLSGLGCQQKLPFENMACTDGGQRLVKCCDWRLSYCRLKWLNRSQFATAEKYSNMDVWVITIPCIWSSLKLTIGRSQI